MKKYFFVLLFLTVNFAFGQKKVPLSLKISKNAFFQSKIPFKIVEVIDNRPDTSNLGQVHDKFGFLTNYYLKEGLERNLKAFYDRGYHSANKGDYRVKVVVNEMRISEPKVGPFNYLIKIEIDYFVASDHGYVLFFEDYYSSDRQIESPKHMPRFCQNFLKRSVKEFHLKLRQELDFLKISEKGLLSLEQRKKEIINKRALLRQIAAQKKDTLLQRLTFENDTVIHGQMQVRVGDFGKLSFQGYVFPEHIQKRIEAEFSNNEKSRGNYLIEYLIAEKNKKITFFRFRFIEDPSSLDPRWITFPLLFLMHLH